MGLLVIPPLKLLGQTAQLTSFEVEVGRLYQTHESSEEGVVLRQGYPSLRPLPMPVVFADLPDDDLLPKDDFVAQLYELKLIHSLGLLVEVLPNALDPIELCICLLALQVLGVLRVSHSLLEGLEVLLELDVLLLYLVEPASEVVREEVGHLIEERRT